MTGDELPIQLADTKTSVKPILSLDEFITRTGGWGTLLALYMALGGKIAGLPASVQQFLATKLEEAKQEAKTP